MCYINSVHKMVHLNKGGTMAHWMDELRADKSTPIWVLDFAQQIDDRELDAADAANGLEVLVKHLNKRCDYLSQQGSTIRGYLTGQY